MLSELLRRRVPQIVGLYLAGAWGFVQFVDWAVGQYALSPHLTNLVVALLLLLVPSILLLAWRYGAPGDDRWTRTESVLVPLNLLVAAAVLFVTFAGKPLGAVTTTVVVENEAGEAVEREVPKEAFRRSVALFPFENETGDTTVDWLRYGLPLATEFDLYQDPFLRVVSPEPYSDTGLMRGLREAGFEDGSGAPLALKRKLAADRHLDVLLTGSLARADSGLVVESELWDVLTGRRVARHTFGGDDPLVLADRISEQLKRDLDIPTLQVEKVQDLPVSELLTRSADAFREFAMGFGETLAGAGFENAARRLEAAVREDSSFALAQIELAQVYYLLNRPAEAAAAIQAAEPFMYRFPERMQLAYRAVDNLQRQQKPEQAFKTAAYLVEVYPQDLEGRSLLALLYGMRGQWEEQIVQLEAILSLDPTRLELLREIGGIYQEHVQYDSALAYFQRYAELAPNDEEAFVAIGEARRLMGEHDLAREAFERALLIAPAEAMVMTKLLRLERDLGSFARAHEWADEALAASRGPEDRAEVYDLLETLYYRQGRFQRVEETDSKFLGAADEYMFPLNIAFAAAQLMGFRAAHEVGREAAAFQRLDSLRTGLPAPFDDLYGVLYAILLAESGDVERARAELRRGRRGIAVSGYEALDGHAAYGEGLVGEREGDCRSAVASYGEAASLSPSELSFRPALGRCQRKLGELEAAEATLGGVLEVVPADAKVRTELARVYEEMGRREEAIAELQAAVEIWKDADPDYWPAREARARLAALRAGA